MITATISTLAAATALAGGAVIGTSAPATGPAAPAPAPGVSVSETQHQDRNAGNHDHPDTEQMAQMHEQMMGGDSGMGGGMMGGDSGMGME
ncbi:hypothetical protein [Arthrobacter sp. 35/47]|uniref:hypothetical protein n=1 Tax=Arthrobacter sp. 35/47 TaxID=269454 RepID=UPI00047C6EF6|nr:hypothetical protein [Arthrobacter sp. 35/47]